LDLGEKYIHRDKHIQDWSGKRFEFKAVFPLKNFRAPVIYWPSLDELP
jgi:hypothetical protein